MKARFPDLRIAGVLGVVPRHVSRFEDEIAQYSQAPANSRRLAQVMGYDTHRVAPAGTTTADLASLGLRRLIDEGRLDPAGVEALFFVSQTPDYLIPATSTVLHGRFGFPQDTYCADINDGCCGYIKGLYEAAAFLTVTGAWRAVLVAGDVLSARISRHDRNSFPLVGDAATVTVIERAPGGAGIDLEIRTDGSGHDKLMIPAGGARLPASPETAELAADEDGNRRAADHLVMQGRDVFAFTQTVVADFILEFLARRDLRPADLDLLLLHQASAFILDRLRLKLEVTKDQLPDDVVRRYGNSSSGTIPMAIVEALRGRPASSMPVRAMTCGFGVGLSWGAALVDLRGLDFCSLIEP